MPEPGTDAGRRREFCRIFAQANSPCGRYLVTGDIYGGVCVFDLQSVLSPTSPRAPLKRFLHPQPIYAAVASPYHLILGDAVGGIWGYPWDAVCAKGADVKADWNLQGTEGGSHLDPAEVNALSLTEDGERLLSGGAGDNALRLWNLEERKCVATLRGHKDYLHDLAPRGAHEALTAGEDGSLRLWDLRTQKSQMELRPSEGPCARPKLGRWLGCVVTGSDWALTGGGPELGFWHLGTKSLMRQMESGSEGGHHALLCLPDRILSGGVGGKVHRWGFNGAKAGEIPVSIGFAYSLHANSSQQAAYNVVTVAGSGPAVDVLFDGAYKAFALNSIPA